MALLSGPRACVRTDVYRESLSICRTNDRMSEQGDPGAQGQAAEKPRAPVPSGSRDSAESAGPPPLRSPRPAPCCRLPRGFGQREALVGLEAGGREKLGYFFLCLCYNSSESRRLESKLVKHPELVRVWDRPSLLLWRGCRWHQRSEGQEVAPITV